MTHDERVHHHLYVESKSPLENAERIASLEELVEELQDKNAKLLTEFDKMDKWHSAELQAAMAENDKLRELVRDWYELAVGGADSLTDWNHAQADLELRMRELGIEVDE